MVELYHLDLEQPILLVLHFMELIPSVLKMQLMCIIGKLHLTQNLLAAATGETVASTTWDREALRLLMVLSIPSGSQMASWSRLFMQEYSQPS